MISKDWGAVVVDPQLPFVAVRLHAPGAFAATGRLTMFAAGWLVVGVEKRKSEKKMNLNEHPTGCIGRLARCSETRP